MNLRFILGSKKYPRPPGTGLFKAKATALDASPFSHETECIS
jgi:hypothetical protein